MGTLGRLLEKPGQNYDKLCIWLSEAAMQNSSHIALAAGVALLTAGLSEMAHAQTQFEPGSGGLPSGTSLQACNKLLQYIEGSFGSLVATAAGIGAIVAAAVGGFKAAWCLLVCSIGAFILRAYITLFNRAC